MKSRPVTDSDWGCIVPLILMVALVIGVFAGCFPQRANAAEVAPSPSPAPDLVGNAIAFNAIACAGTALIFALGAILVIKSISRNSNSN